MDTNNTSSTVNVKNTHCTQTSPITPNKLTAVIALSTSKHQLTSSNNAYVSTPYTIPPS